MSKRRRICLGQIKKMMGEAKKVKGFLDREEATC